MKAKSLKFVFASLALALGVGLMPKGEDVYQQLNSPFQSALNSTGVSVDDFNLFKDDVGASLNNIQNGINGMQKSSKMSKNLNIAKAGIKIVSKVVVGALKATGVIKDPKAEALKAILGLMLQISQQVKEINNKLDAINEDLQEDFAEMGVQFAASAIRSDLIALQNFDSNALNNFITKLEININSMLNDFCANGNLGDGRDSYSFDSALVIGMDNLTDKTITIDADDVEVAVEHVNQNYGKLNLDDPKSWFDQVLTKLLSNYIESGDFATCGLSEARQKRREYGYSDESFASALSDAFYSYLLTEFFTNICKADSGNFVAELLSSYNNYCSTLNSLSSPVLCQYDIIQNAFDFQGDTNYLDSSGNQRNLILDIGNYYIYNVSQFASLALIAGLVSENCKTSVLTGIAETSRNTTSSILSKMKRFYKVDENGTPIDNYCYRTSCPVKVIDNFITTDDENFVVTDISTDKFDIVDLEGDKDGYSFGNLKVNKGDPGEIVGGQDLIFLSMMAKRFQKIDDFRGYLGDVLGKEVTTNLVTSFNKYENFNAKEWQTWMNAYQFGMPMDGRLAYNNPGEELGFKHYQVMPAKADYKGDDYALSSDQFQVHQQFSGSYFDVDSGSVKEDEPLYSIAFYYEGHTHKDDIAVLSQSNVAGYKLSEPSIFNDNRFAGQTEGTVVYDDGNMVVTSKTVDKGSDRTITTWDIKFNVLAQSMVKDTSVTYGEWEPTKAPSTQYFNIGQAKSIQDTIDDYNEEHTSDPLLDFQDFNNDAKYWVSYDMSNYESDEEHDALYQYTKELSNLQTLDQKYNSEVSKFNEKFMKLNDESDKITIDDNLPDDTVDEIVAKIKLLKEYGRDTKGFVEPDDTCSDYKLLANVNYQLGEELKLDGENKVIPNYYPSYVVEPVLSYTKDGTTYDFELPIEVASILETKNIKVKLPLLQHDRSKDAVEFKYNEDVAEFGTNSSLLRAKVSTQNVTNNEEIDYFEVSVPNFAAYTLTSEQDGIYDYDEVKTVGGLAPTCSADGYKSCYEKGGNYYEDPTTQTPIADYEAWKTGAGKLNQLTTHDNIHFESKFDESTKEFTFDIICDDCGETIDTKTLSGTFVKDSDADCTECAKGHYVTFGKYESQLSPKTLTLVGKTDTGSADEPGSTPEPHKLTHHFGIPASCTRNGIKSYWKCDDCEAYFYDEGATQPVDNPEDLIIPQLDHEMTYHPASEATEIKSGNVEYWTCSHCNGFFLDEDGNEQTSESEILIPPTLHIYVQTEEMKEVRPTHYTSGHKAYYYCAKDDSYAIDSKGYEEIVDINVWLAPGGEGYIPKESCEFGGPVSYVISNDKCTATHACMYPGCKEVEQETVDATFIVDTPATCTEDARGHYIAEFANPEFGTYSTSLNSDVRVGTATGHKFTVATPTWNGNLCTVSGTCENCHKSLSLTKEGTLVIDTPATCTTNAIGHYEVEFDNLRIEKQFTDPFTINNSALGHLFDNGECTRCHAKDPSAGAMSTGGIVGLTIGCSVGSVLIYAVVQYLINTKKIGKKKKTSKR